MANLLAYIPVLNQRHVDWFKRHPGSQVFLITQAMAEEFLPRLARNMAGVPTELMISTLQSNQPETREIFVQSVTDFAPDWEDPNLESPARKHWIVAGEDVSKAVAEKYLAPAGCTFELEMIWARWDMSAVTKKQPVLPDDIVMSSSLSDQFRMDKALKEAARSPDWWRQIGAVAWRDEKCLALSHNRHMPNEYETYIFGDPRLNVDAGQKGVYCSIHAERAVIALSARSGHSLLGASLYVTTFPCEDCAREIALAGFSHVYFQEPYSVLNAVDVLRAGGVKLIQVVEEPGSA